MPVIHSNSYRPPLFLRGKHLETIYPALFRSVTGLPDCKRKVHLLSDGDSLTYDHYRNNQQKVVIISHGLEGNSRKPYVLGMAKKMLSNGFDVIAWNFRSCDGKMNNTSRFYHSGATDDLNEIVNIASEQYEKIYLTGFSLGANLTLKYAGEALSYQHQKIERIAAICTPLNLKAGSVNIGKKSNVLYEKRFLKSLKNKVIAKARLMPDQINTGNLSKVKTLYDFDNYFTAPIHGFKDAEDYYHQCSSIRFVNRIKVETLVLNALNDPMLPQETFDSSVFNSLNSVTLELTESGGHCGFPGSDKEGHYWSEKRVLKFFND
ncbi:MAG: alpha/beta fold hydrolase [Bacteroidota bacterium]